MFCAGTRWGGTLCHGMMLYSLISHLIRARLLPGAIELEQELVFPGPVFAGDEVTVRAEIVRVDRTLGRVEVCSSIRRAGGGLGCESRTLVSVDV